MIGSISLIQNITFVSASFPQLLDFFIQDLYNAGRQNLLYEVMGCLKMHLEGK